MEPYLDCRTPQITIPLVITSTDIKLLYDEIENCDNSTLVEFITHLLSEVDSYATIQLQNAKEILKINPISIKGEKNEMF